MPLRTCSFCTSKFTVCLGGAMESAWIPKRIHPGSIPGRGITFMLPTPTDMCSRGAAASALGLQRRGYWIESIQVSSFSFDHKQIISCVLRRQSWHELSSLHCDSGLHISAAKLGRWSSSIVLALLARGPGFKAHIRPLFIFTFPLFLFAE